MIRFGEKRSEVSAEIILPERLLPELNKIFEKADILVEDNVLVIRRVITQNSTRNFINDTSVTLQLLKSVGDYLIDIHGVNDHQSLFKQSLQLILLDRYGDVQELLLPCIEAYKKLKQIQKDAEKQLENLPSAIEADHLKMSIAEIKRVNPQPNEDDEISEKFKRAANSKDLVETASKVAYALDRSENSIVEQFSNIYRELQHLEQLDEERCAAYVKDADAAIETMRCLADDLESYGESVEIDPEEFMMLEERLGAIQTLKRRYGPYLENVFKTLKEAENKLYIFENSESVRLEFEQKEKQQRSVLQKCAEILSKARQ
jgi:DNA repair protein RecN (Recombination protein N)